MKDSAIDAEAYNYRFCLIARLTELRLMEWRIAFEREGLVDCDRRKSTFVRQLS